MNKKMSQVEVCFRTVLYSSEEILSTADFKVIDKHILSHLKKSALSFTPKIQLPREIYIQPLRYTQTVFQLNDVPQRHQRNALAVLLAKFSFLSEDFLHNIVNHENSYISITYIKYNRLYYKVRIALERISFILEEKKIEDLQQENLMIKRREEQKFMPNPKLRRLRRMPIKRLRDYQMLELVEKSNI